MLRAMSSSFLHGRLITKHKGEAYEIYGNRRTSADDSGGSISSAEELSKKRNVFSNDHGEWNPATAGPVSCRIPRDRCIGRSHHTSGRESACNLASHIGLRENQFRRRL